MSVESGCVAAGTGGVGVTGAAACASGNVGGNEVPVSSPISAAALGLTDFSNLQIILSGDEPAPGEALVVENLALSMWNPADGSIIDAKNLAAAAPILDANPGFGSAG